ncbi:2-oxoacid:ferredoxin oxidoreductase subunit beta [Alkaliphilus peptidifermentans]|uniref:2-oxoglutarate ferredoxin oxidoreductase subunit beta n=1 Tax=Alkaliphilus peptidifermentans DSM 18978 TaxID=1120976 RepID=A0A1G5HSW2_9FIRM|nr:2-oxoacid:ferredoxin oxidoreductase subunit beta [Alkaliphilus peptidifermentans]SCY66945.1 2-oxoglutarate ferredoxin oxidoreductase subunit beta [Alkaliphilus peptidifermentans DSM 18978]
MKSMKDYSNSINPNWCPGCGHFSVLRAIQIASAKLTIPNEELTIVTGIGCSGRLSGYINAYGFHGIHGRSLPIAQGIKLANKKLTVIAAGGDGDGFAIGLSHTLHAIRRDINITYIVLNNQVYGLTKGHTSPLSGRGFITKSTPYGSTEPPIQPGILALANGATFLAQGFSAFQDQLVDIIVKAIKHTGFSMVNVFSPCVTYNKVNTYQWFRDSLTNLDDITDYKNDDYQSSLNKLVETNGLCTGIIYNKAPDIGSYTNSNLQKPLVELDLKFNKEEFSNIMESFK